MSLADDKMNLYKTFNQSDSSVRWGISDKIKQLQSKFADSEEVLNNSNTHHWSDQLIQDAEANKEILIKPPKLISEKETESNPVQKLHKYPDMVKNCNGKTKHYIDLGTSRENLGLGFDEMFKFNMAEKTDDNMGETVSLNGMYAYNKDFTEQQETFGKLKKNVISLNDISRNNIQTNNIENQEQFINYEKEPVTKCELNEVNDDNHEVEDNINNDISRTDSDSSDVGKDPLIQKDGVKTWRSSKVQQAINEVFKMWHGLKMRKGLSDEKNITVTTDHGLEEGGETHEKATAELYTLGILNYLEDRKIHVQKRMCLLRRNVAYLTITNCFLSVVFLLTIMFLLYKSFSEKPVKPTPSTLDYMYIYCFCFMEKFLIGLFQN